MEQILGIWKWLGENVGLLSGILLGLIGVAELVTSLTSSEKDDKAVSVVKKYILSFLGFFKKKEDAGKDSSDPK